MIDVQLADLAEIASGAIEELQVEGQRFNEYVDRIGLDPNSDFICCDLSGVDLSGADLRGFDFSHANLTGAYGANITYDSSTKFVGADVSGSVFEYDLSIRKIFENDAKLDSEYNKFLQKDFFSQQDWIMSAGKSGKSVEKEASLIAQRLFIESEDLSIKNSLALFIDDFFENDDIYRQFLIRELSNRSNNTDFVMSTIRTLAFVYYDNRIVIEVLNRLLYDERLAVQKTAYHWLRNSSNPHASIFVKEFEASVEGAEFFREQLRTAIRRLGWGFEYVFDPLLRAEQLSQNYKLNEEDLQKILQRIHQVSKRTARNKESESWKQIHVTPGQEKESIPRFNSILRQLQTDWDIFLLLSTEAKDVVAKNT